MRTHNIPLYYRKSKRSLSCLLLTWSFFINTHWLELPLSRTNVHGPNGVRAIEVRLYSACAHLAEREKQCGFLLVISTFSGGMDLFIYFECEEVYVFQASDATYYLKDIPEEKARKRKDEANMSKKVKIGIYWHLGIFAGGAGRGVEASRRPKRFRKSHLCQGSPAPQN